MGLFEAMSTDWELQWLLNYRNLFPNFRQNHFLVYRALWGGRTWNALEVAGRVCLSERTVRRKLRDLEAAGLAGHFGHGYFVADPEHDYDVAARHVEAKLEAKLVAFEKLLEKMGYPAGAGRVKNGVRG